MLTTEGIPLKMYGKNCEVNLKLCGDNGNYWVEVRSSIDHDEKVAIILQMFEEGINDSIAMEVANRIKQGVIDKACEVVARLYPHAAAYYEQPEVFVEQIRKAMEE